MNLYRQPGLIIFCISLFLITIEPPLFVSAVDKKDISIPGKGYIQGTETVATDETESDEELESVNEGAGSESEDDSEKELSSPDNNGGGTGPKTDDNRLIHIFLIGALVCFAIIVMITVIRLYGRYSKKIE